MINKRCGSARGAESEARSRSFMQSARSCHRRPTSLSVLSFTISARRSLSFYSAGLAC